MINLKTFERNLNVFYYHFNSYYRGGCGSSLEEVREHFLNHEYKVKGRLIYKETNVIKTVCYDSYIALLASVVIRDIENIINYVKEAV